MAGWDKGAFGSGIKVRSIPEQAADDPAHGHKQLQERIDLDP